MKFIAATVLSMLSAFAKATQFEVIQYDGPTECAFEESVRPGHFVQIHYVGSIDERSPTGERGKVFDSTYDRDLPRTLKIGSGQVIPGLDQGLQGLCNGTSVTIAFPSEYGFGEKGSDDFDVPAGASLHYDVAIVDISLEEPGETNLFYQMDLDDSGDISKDELESYMEAVLGRKQIPEGLWEKEDKDKDGYISWEEFSGPKGSEPPTSTLNAFEIIDVDKNGYITRDELEAFALRVHERSVPDSVWEREDKNGDGLVSWEEFTGKKGRKNPNPPKF